MRLYHDRPDVFTLGRWTFAGPGAQWFPTWHLFGSSNWDPDGRIDPLLGEQGTWPRKWSNGRIDPRLTGQQWCGAVDLYQHGSPYSLRGSLEVDALGVPICCGAGAILGGGDIDQGDAAQGFAYQLAADLGDADDGAAYQGDPYQLEAIGGDADDGAASRWWWGRHAASGGDADDGLAVQPGVTAIAGIGGDADDGVSIAGGWYPHAASGGEAEDGLVVQGLHYPVAGLGGDSDSGAAYQAGYVGIHGLGGDADDGLSEQGAGEQMQWERIDLPYTDFQAVATSKLFSVSSLPAGRYLHAAVLYVDTLFTVSAEMASLQVSVRVGGVTIGSPIDPRTERGWSHDAAGIVPAASWPDGSALQIASMTAIQAVEIYAVDGSTQLQYIDGGNATLWLATSDLP